MQLWKRRWTEVDTAGHIVFSTSRPVSGAGRSFTTKFHMSELHAPYTPDVDRQELPHSVVFELNDGTGATLMCASEDAMSQRQLLSRE